MSNEERKAIGNRLKKLRTNMAASNEEKIKQSFIAEKVLHCTNSLYCKIETGKAELTIDNAMLLSQFFGVSVDYLLFGKDEDLISAARQFYGVKNPPRKETMSMQDRSDYLQAIRYRKMLEAIQATAQITKMEKGRKKEIVQCIYLNGKGYAIDPGVLPDLLAATIEIARTTFDSLCRTNNIDRVMSKISN